MNSSLRWAWWEHREALWSYQVTWIMCPKTLLARFMLVYGGIVCSCLVIATCQQWTWPTRLWVSPSISAWQCWPWKWQVSETRNEVCTAPNTRQSLDIFSVRSLPSALQAGNGTSVWHTVTLSVSIEMYKSNLRCSLWRLQHSSDNNEFWSCNMIWSI